MVIGDRRPCLAEINKPLHNVSITQQSNSERTDSSGIIFFVYTFLWFALKRALLEDF